MKTLRGKKLKEWLKKQMASAAGYLLLLLLTVIALKLVGGRLRSMFETKEIYLDPPYDSTILKKKTIAIPPQE